MNLINLINGPSNKIGVAYSGGADSLFAAHILANKYGKDVTLYHYNHRLIESDNDICEQSMDAAFQLGLPIRVGVNKDQTYSKGSKEDYCRQLRYGWFSGLATTLVTGHHINDCVESYVMRCLTGHPEYLPIPISSQFEDSRVIRPFILTPKNGIDNYLQEHCLTHLIVEDELNKDTSIRRNWLRLNLIPQIKEKTNLEKVVKKRYLEYLKKNPLTKPKSSVN